MAKQEDPLLSLVFKPAWLGKVGRSSVSDKEIEQAKQEIESDPSYEKNGWTPETLATYFKERKIAQSDVILHRGPPPKPKRTNGWHNAHKWRRK